MIFNTNLIILILIVGGYVNVSMSSKRVEGYSRKEDGLIVELPGSPKVDFKQYSGYITVDDNKGRALFYLFVEADINATEKPLLLWLNGGPGCSSIGYGAMAEIGPFLINSDGTALQFNRYSWNNVTNLLFVDSPAGVGFSYANSSSVDAYNDLSTADDNMIFLKKWLDEFPTYKKSDFYIAGESYAGHYVPQLAQRVLLHNKASIDPINFAGILVGNPVTDYYIDEMGKLEFEYGHGMISNETYERAQNVCVSSFTTGDFTKDCTKILDQIKNEIGNIDTYSIFTDLCSSSSSSSSSSSPVLCYEDLAAKYFNNETVQKALHVNSDLIIKPWTTCNYEIYENWNFNISSVLPIIRELIDAGLKLLYYSGDTDLMVPFTGTRKAISSLGLPEQESWRPWYANQKHGGWTIKYKGIGYLIVRGAGHQVPQMRKEAAFTLFTSFIEGNDLPYK